MEKSETASGKRSRESYSIDLPPLKKFHRVEAVKEEVHKKCEEKLAELEEKLRQAKQDADFYFWQAEELDSLLQNALHQNEPAQNQNAEEESGENDEAMSECSIGQSGSDKWTCRLCEKREVSVAVLPCSHLCLCFDCAVDLNPQKCLVCGKGQKDLFFIHKD